MSSGWQDPRTPKCDEKKLNALYSPFRQRDLNPVAYDSKMKYWTDKLNESIENMKIAAFTVSGIQKDFARNNKTPSCISEVVEQLIRAGDVMALDDFKKMTAQTWKTWFIDSLIVTPAVWSFSKLKEALFTTTNQDITYVSINYIKKITDEIMNKVGKEGLVVTPTEFQTLPNTILPESTLNLVIHWMKFENKALVHTSDNLVIIKINQNVKPFTESEVVNASLKEQRRKIALTVHSLEEENIQLMNEVKNCLKKGARATAKQALRKTKELNKCIIRKSQALENIDSLISQIENIKDDVKIFESYKYGITALKSTIKESGLTEENVNDTMLEIKELQETYDDIQSALSEPITDSDEVELEAELLNIVNSAKGEKAEQDIPDLPDVPTTPPQLKENKSNIYQPMRE